MLDPMHKPTVKMIAGIILLGAILFSVAFSWGQHSGYSIGLVDGMTMTTKTTKSLIYLSNLQFRIKNDKTSGELDKLNALLPLAEYQPTPWYFITDQSLRSSFIKSTDSLEHAFPMQ